MIHSRPSLIYILPINKSAKKFNTNPMKRDRCKNWGGFFPWFFPCNKLAWSETRLRTATPILAGNHGDVSICQSRVGRPKSNCGLFLCFRSTGSSARLPVDISTCSCRLTSCFRYQDLGFNDAIFCTDELKSDASRKYKTEVVYPYSIEI